MSDKIYHISGEANGVAREGYPYNDENCEPKVFTVRLEELYSNLIHYIFDYSSAKRDIEWLKPKIYSFIERIGTMEKIAESRKIEFKSATKQKALNLQNKQFSSEEISLKETTNFLFTAFYEIERWQCAQQNVELTFEEFNSSMSAEFRLWDADFIAKLLSEKGYRLTKNKQNSEERADPENKNDKNDD